MESQESRAVDANELSPAPSIAEQIRKKVEKEVRDEGNRPKQLEWIGTNGERASIQGLCTENDC